jgi:hypothetical protein
MSKSLKQLHFAQAKTRYIPLQTGLRFHSRGYEQPPHQGAHGIINSKRLAGDRCTSSNNDLRLGRLDSSSDGPRANATAEGPSFTSLAEDENQPLKPKSRRPGAQVAPTVSSAETTAGARGSLAYGDHHLSTDDGGHLPTTPRRRTTTAPKRTGRSSLPSSPRPSQNTSTALAVYDVLSDPLVQLTVRGGPGRGRPARGTTAARVEDGKLHPSQGAAVRLPPHGWRTPPQGWRMPFSPKRWGKKRVTDPRGGGPPTRCAPPPQPG